jgi:hypothetical protein
MKFNYFNFLIPFFDFDFDENNMHMVDRTIAR